jgi:hypothetical protein
MSDDDLMAAYLRLTTSLRPPTDAAQRVRDAITARRRRRLGAASGLTVAAVAGGALVATGVVGSSDRDTLPPVVTPPTPTGTTQRPGRQPSYAELHAIDEYEWETSFGQYRKDLLALAQSYDNYTGYQLNFRLRSLRVLGAGDAPPAVARMIGEGPTRAHPVWVSMRYSYKELKHAEDALFRALPHAGSGSVRRDFTGVVIGMFGKLPPEREARLQAIARSITDVPVTFTAHGAASPLDLVGSDPPQPD